MCTCSSAIGPIKTSARSCSGSRARVRRILFQEFPHLKKQYWGRHLWARGYFALTSGTITDEMINAYINEQEGEPVEDDSRFQIDPLEPLAL